MQAMEVREMDEMKLQGALIRGLVSQMRNDALDLALATEHQRLEQAREKASEIVEAAAAILSTLTGMAKS